MPAPTFTFTFKAIAGDQTETDFEVLAFEGEEQISQPFEYRLTLKHPTTLTDFGKVVNQNAELVMTQMFDDPSNSGRTTTTTRVNGIVARFRAKQRFVVADGPDYVTYEALLVPKMWRLGLFHQSRIFQGRTVAQIISDVFAQEVSDGVAALNPGSSSSDSSDADYEIRLSGIYEPRDFCVQYRESDLAFIHRLMEHEGIYYFFDGGRLIITDDKTHESATSPNVVGFSEGTGGPTLMDDVIYRFNYDERIVPRGVKMRDYDYETYASTHSPDPTFVGGAPTAEGAYARVGTHYEHGVFSEKRHFDPFTKSDDPDLYSAYCDAEVKRTERVKRIADVRAQELEAQRVSGRGESNVLRLRAGHVFDFRGEYPFPTTLRKKVIPGVEIPSAWGFLVTRVQHRYLPLSTAEDSPSVYLNTFVSLPESMQYRPPRITPVPRVPGVMTAKVVAEPEPVAPTPPDPNASDYVIQQVVYEQDQKEYEKALEKYRACEPFEGPVDKEGKYRLEIPFDAADQPAPSKRVRLAQPHAGTDYGFHFPNRPDTEMVFACVDGDPDRPLGLSMVANPWTHSPVPTKARELRTQNPWTGSIAGDELTFDEYKNVIRSARGHQIVMDDNTGSQNVGITLQTGSYINTASVSNVDVYWKTRIEMGGYRIKSALEQGIDGMTEALGWLKNLLLRDLPEMAGMLLGMAASHVESGNYGEDTFGATTPVGIDMKTDQAVNIKGIKGVNITSPNFFGMFSTNFVGDSKTQKEGQHVAESVAKGIIKTVWQEVANDTVNDFIDVKDRVKDYKKDYPNYNKHALEAFRVRENFFKARVKAWVNILLNRTGVNISSAGELKMASMSGATVVAGDNGMLLKSFGSISQKANRGIDINTQQGISIKTNGKPFEGKGLVSKIKEFTSKLGPPGRVVSHFLIDPWAGIDSVSTKEIEDYVIDIHNEHSSVLIHTGAKGVKGKGNVMAHAHGEEGDVKLFSNNGNVHVWAAGSGREENIVVLETGSRARLEDDAATAPLKPDGENAATARLALSRFALSGFSKENIDLSVGDKWNGADNDGIDIIKDGRIRLKCGDSMILLSHDGTITLKGKAIKIESTQDDVKIDSAKNVATTAAMKSTMKGKQVEISGDATAEVKTKKLDMSGQMTTLGGSMIKIG